METLRDAVIEKAKEEASKIIEEAKRRANEIINEALTKKKELYERKKEEVLSEVKRTYIEKRSEVIIEGRKELSKVKNEIIKELMRELHNRLRTLSKDERIASLRSLLIGVKDLVLETGKDFKIYCCEEDIPIVNDLISRLGLSDVVRKVEVLNNCNKRIGGFVLEALDGSVIIDNTYLTRLDAVLKSMIPEITKKLFGKGR